MVVLPTPGKPSTSTLRMRTWSIVFDGSRAALLQLFDGKAIDTTTTEGCHPMRHGQRRAERREERASPTGGFRRSCNSDTLQPRHQCHPTTLRYTTRPTGFEDQCPESQGAFSALAKGGGVCGIMGDKAAWCVLRNSLQRPSPQLWRASFFSALCELCWALLCVGCGSPPPCSVLRCWQIVLIIVGIIFLVSLALCF